MRIKKVSQTTPTQAQVVDGYSTSTTDSYSCNYVNNNITNAKILWTNPSPTNDFATQTITLNSSDYDLLMWIFKTGTSVVMVYNIKGYGAKTIDITGNTNTRRRQIDYVSDISYTIGNAYGEDGNIRNGALIPLYVIGYKTGLFS